MVAEIRGDFVPDLVGTSRVVDLSEPEDELFGGDFSSETIAFPLRIITNSEMLSQEKPPFNSLEV